ncbi:Exopolysaccharide biosynthesis protein YbjH [Pseudoxanthomonas sp. GM95]|uniref:YjbH domain-containing protein n=1 Tax=Pseudoxanthomonas sp. GM95 TaxID=1881043 RepID=UPI0008D0B3BD|nr:YjbH domain-containing protein [Pseudoxanthomonas sp. GM95]SEM45133.1 Exopolysaccharide biosynthesis protein YbjH [Pseudoxanthomonas sp. GM95]
MRRLATTRLHRQLLLALGLAGSGAAHAQLAPSPTQSDWGGTGLLQMPGAHMAEQGELSFSASHVSPYSRYNVALQPFPWLEGTFRYTSISNRGYGPADTSGTHHYKDKSIDVKLRLWQESHWLPEVALGIRDIGGTGLFAGEYLVASKRIGPFDVTVGAATGYMGNRGDIGNPLGVLDDRFKTRPDSGTATGNFSGSSMFRGRVGLFGGIAYQTPWAPLQLKLEVDGNDYQHEPQDNNQRQSTPINAGLVYSLNRGVQIGLGWERGQEVMASITFHSNLGTARAYPKLLDPPPVPMAAPRAADARGQVQAGRYRDAAEQVQAQRAQTLEAMSAIDWSGVAQRLHDNAGIDVQQIAVRGRELVVTGEQNRFFYPATGLGRAARVLDSRSNGQVDWFTVVNTRVGLPLGELSIGRDALQSYLQHDADLKTLALSTEATDVSSQQRDVLYRAPINRFQNSLSPGFKQVLGGPNGFLLYQISADYDATFFFTRSIWLSGTVSANLLNNFDRFTYDAPSNLPRVRSYMRQYLTTSDITLPNLQLTAAHRLSNSWYGMAYGGLLESMFAGVGGEVLYRPYGERWAVGAELNQVTQRGFDQRFDMRGYHIATGHLSGYYAFGDTQRTVVSLSAGRYLAGDLGATLNIGRVFANGVTMGAYATKTNVSSAEYGEGSFDKGIYFSVPMDLLLPRSTRGRATVVWAPLTRDGGAKLNRQYSLYQLTSERDTDLLWDNLDQVGQ